MASVGSFNPGVGTGLVLGEGGGLGCEGERGTCHNISFLYLLQLGERLFLFVVFLFTDITVQVGLAQAWV